MKFEDNAQVQIDDKNVDRSQGAARAISVRLHSYLEWRSYTLAVVHRSFTVLERYTVVQEHHKKRVLFQ